MLERNVTCELDAARVHGEHPCSIAIGAGGLIDDSWCFSRFAAVLESMPDVQREEDVVKGDFLLVEDGPLTVHYTAFDRINTSATVVIIGITPGRQQMFLAAQEAQRQLKAGASLDEALSRATDTASFGGPMRRNLVTMLDTLGVHQKLGIATVDRLFDERADLLHGTSALLHAVFWNGGNYAGSPEPDRLPVLRAFVDQVLAAELAAVPEALVIPLGKCVEAQLHRLAEDGRLDPGRCLFGFPHPSGGNGHRVRLFQENFDRMATQVSEWSVPGL